MPGSPERNTTWPSPAFAFDHRRSNSYVRGLVNAPDVVAYPPTEEEVAAVLDWAGGAQASVTPFGGGSSVVGGVEQHRDAVRGEGGTD